MKKDCCIVVPAYRPGDEMIRYVSELLSAGIGPVAVIDDGSGASYGALFGQVRELPGCTVLSHRENRGKGAALKTAMKWYLEERRSGSETVAECLGIITADCDGQHAVKDVLGLVQALREDGERGGESLILGCRSFGEGTPGRSALGNRMISAGMKLLYGIELKDTQTGLRAIPEALLPDMIGLAGDRYEFELNMLIYTRKACVPLVPVPIQTIYFDGNKGSHYRPVRDSLKIFAQLCRGVVQYGLSSALSAAVDVVMYGMLIKWLLTGMPFGQRLFLAAAGARIVSSVINYSCNRQLPYVQNTRVFPTALRYYTLWTVQLAASIGMVWLLCEWTGMDELAAKLATDLFLAAASYQVQMRWVFCGEEPEKAKRYDRWISGKSGEPGKGRHGRLRLAVPDRNREEM